MSNHLPTNHSDVPIRLFKSDFLEFFTHISPIVVLIIWLPVSLYFLITSIITLPAGVSAVFIPITFLFGLILWTFSEYNLHRFLFHYEPKNATQEKIFFMFHGIHHAQPQCKTRLVMPPVLSIPMAAIFYGLFVLIFTVILGIPHWVAPTFAGFILGYLAYDLIHYATHHFAMRDGYLKYIKRYHMQHHYKTPTKRFGVTSPIWDVVFNTKPVE